MPSRGRGDPARRPGVADAPVVGSAPSCFDPSHLRSRVGVMPHGRSALIVAVVLGLLAGLVAYFSIKKQEADARRGWKLVPVTVAAQDILEGSVLTPDMVETRSIPEQFVTSS